MNHCWLVLTPPLCVIILAFITQNVRISLLLGILSAGLIAHDFSLIQACQTIIKRLWEVSELYNLTSWKTFWESDKIFICFFILFLGILITLLQRSGGAYAYGTMMIKKLTYAKSAEQSSLMLSMFLFLDDYFSSLTVGSVMQPITDRFKIPRVKIALLVSVIAGPMAVLIPLSSWMAYIIGQLQMSGVTHAAAPACLIIGDPFYVYLHSIPYLFYPIIVVISLWLFVRWRLSHSILAKHEAYAQQTGNLFGNKTPVIQKTPINNTPHAHNNQTGRWLIDFLFPLAFLVLSIVIGCLWGGGFYLFGGINGLLATLQHTNVQAALFVGSFLTIIATTITQIARKNITVCEIPEIIRGGFSLLGTTIITLLLIWTLASLVKNDLATGQYIASLLQNKIALVGTTFFPVIFLCLAICIANMMGSAWGTMGILFPIAIPMMVSLHHLPTPIYLGVIPQLYPLVGALISGSIIGSNSSLLSDTMLMAATSTSTYHMDLVKAQLSFIIPTAFSCLIAFTINSYLTPRTSGVLAVAISLATGIIINLSILKLLSLFKHEVKIDKPIKTD
jgi:Na+/H+ antiporter NhaC